jgi:hypothetical protein
VISIFKFSAALTPKSSLPSVDKLCEVLVAEVDSR